MEKIYSKVEEGLLLHVVWRLYDFQDGRIDILPVNGFLQCAAMSHNAGKTFRPHKIAQEAWHVIKGRVKCILYDLDDTIIAEPILYEGDTSFTLYGGHTYKVLSDPSKILEFKTGPYLGQENDKTFIE
jgi:hypothetical protein